MTSTLFACFNCQSLLKDRYGVDIDMPLVHTYIPLKKSYYQKVWELYQDRIEKIYPINFAVIMI